MAAAIPAYSMTELAAKMGQNVNERRGDPTADIGSIIIDHRVMEAQKMHRKSGL